MPDVTIIHLSKVSEATTTRFIEGLLFRNHLSAAKFAMSYMLLHCTEDDIINWIADSNNPVFLSDGNTYNVGTIDPDSVIQKTLLQLFPNCDAPYVYMRVLMNKGLEVLGGILQTPEDLKNLIKESFNLS